MSSISFESDFAMAGKSPLERALGDSAIPEIKPDTPQFEAIGRFITSFALAEAGCHMLARKLSGLSDAKARIIFSGMRLSDISAIIRQIIKIDQLEEAEVDACLTQLSLIEKRRHSLVHRTTNVSGGGVMVTNFMTAKSQSSREIETISHQELSDMQRDCTVIYLRLTWVYKVQEPGADPDYLAYLNGPWRYKHLAPKTPNLKSRSTPAKGRRRPPASRGKP
jgi:hypothetical protein